MDYGKKLLEFRAKHNLTQKQLAELLSVSSYMVFRYEADMNKPSAKNKIKFENKMKEWEEKNDV